MLFREAVFGCFWLVSIACFCKCNVSSLDCGFCKTKDFLKSRFPSVKTLENSYRDMTPLMGSTSDVEDVLVRRLMGAAATIGGAAGKWLLLSDL